jgi:hypothetical protein
MECMEHHTGAHMPVEALHDAKRATTWKSLSGIRDMPVVTTVTRVVGAQLSNLSSQSHP